VTVYEVLGILASGLVCGFLLGWTVCAMTYVRYRKTKDAMRVVDSFNSSLIKNKESIEDSRSKNDW
jgi:uncharacterized membrane protein YciS (DUF1049 family)